MPSFFEGLGQSLLRAAAIIHDNELLEAATKREMRISELSVSKRVKPYRMLVSQMNNSLSQITSDEVRADFIQLKSLIESQKIPEAQSAMLVDQDSPRKEQFKD